MRARRDPSARIPSAARRPAQSPAGAFQPILDLQRSVGNRGVQALLARMPLDVFKQRVGEVDVGRKYTYEDLVRHLEDNHLGNKTWLDSVIEGLAGFDAGLVERLIRHVIRDYRTTPQVGGQGYLERGLPADDFSESEHVPAARHGGNIVVAFADRLRALPAAPPGLPPPGMNPDRKGFLLDGKPSSELLDEVRTQGLKCLAIRTVPDGSDWIASPSTLFLVVVASLLAPMRAACQEATFENGPGVYDRWLGSIVGYGSGEVERWTRIQRANTRFKLELYDISAGDQPPSDQAASVGSRESKSGSESSGEDSEPES
jgi:hypothetical protein